MAINNRFKKIRGILYFWSAVAKTHGDFYGNGNITLLWAGLHNWFDLLVDGEERASWFMEFGFE